MKRSPAALVLLHVAALACVLPSSASAATKAECVAAYEDGQRLRAKGALGAAREDFLVCADPSCPNATRGDCTRWVGEVDQSMPTVSFAVRDRDGKDVADVAVFVDDAQLAARLEGKALPIDPGKHRLRFVRGDEDVTVEVVIREGEKNRAIDIELGERKIDAPPAGAGTLSPGVWVLAGVGALGFTMFGIMGGVALAERSDAEATCAPDCSDSQVASIRAKFIVADVSLGVGVAGLASAVVVGVLDLTSGGDGKPPVGLVVGPLSGGAFVGVSGTY